MEFDCDPAEESALLGGTGTVLRHLRVGRRIMLYLNNVTAHIDLIRQWDQGDRRALVVRPTNLEDVLPGIDGDQPGGRPVSVSFPHAFSVWRRNAAIYKRTWLWNILPNFFEPVFYLVAIGVGVGSYITQMGGTSYITFLAPALVCVAAMHGASYEVTYNVYVRLIFEKTYDAMLTTPIEPDDILAGEALWAVTRASIYGGAFFVIVLLAGLAPLPSALLVLPLVPLTGLLFALIGMVFSLRIPSIDLFSYYFTMFLTPLFLFSGVFFPLEERLPESWLWIAEILPLLHPVRLARAAFRARPLWSSCGTWHTCWVCQCCWRCGRVAASIGA